ncbi:phosphatidylinositol-specific phospholipase C domain-containing protein, partial [Enterococcus hirae]|nr:phosphatidylinositol-specific phospholipase C domain-containing protein [Enterococcus hirae]
MGLSQGIREFSNFKLNKNGLNNSPFISSKDNLLDPLYKLVAGIVFDKAFKRSSPNLEDASNTTSEKSQWDNFLNGTAKSERWITGTPEEGHEVKLHAYYVDHHSNTTVIVQHGYNANSMSVKNQAEMFWNQGYNILLPDARGTGFSEGNYETLGGLESKDMNLWINDETNNGKKIILWGQSMGAATVMLATNLQKVNAIIEDCGFTTLENELVDIVDSYIKTIPGASEIAYGGIERIIALINSMYYEPTFGVSLYSVSPENAVANNGVPKLFIHGTADTFVPFKDMEILFGDASGFKKKYVVDGAGHCQSYSKDPSKYAQEVQEFLSTSLNMPRYTQADWMSRLGDDLRVSQFSIPGTHDSCATHGVLGIGKEQSLSLPEQLNAGIRYLDIRCKYTNGTFAIHHGPVYQQLMFGDVLNQVIDFLNKHPKETVFMRVKQEQSHVDDKTFNNTFLNHYALDSAWKKYFWNNEGNNKQNPRLKDIRGKIVVLYNVAGLNFGLDYAHGIFDIQDEYNADYSEKLNAVMNYMNRANTGDINTGYINYLSSTNVNSGQMNDAIANELETKNYHRVGILAADFPTERLITDVISTNINIMDRKTNLNIENPPKYIVYDPQSGNYTNENDETNFTLDGVWSSSILGANTFNIQLADAQDPVNSWYWSGGDATRLNLNNTKRINNLHYDLSSMLNFVKTTGTFNSNSGIKNLNDIPISKKAVVLFGMIDYDGWEKPYITIPFYVKAPKVTVDDSPSNLQKMLSNQTITGRGQVGDTVTIKDGSQTWTGQVQSDGNFSIQTKGLKVNDKVTITEVNGTGDKSVSDPLEITMPLMNELKITQQPKYIVYDPQSKTFVDENGSTNFSLSGTWSSTVQGKNVFNWQIGAASDPINNWYVYGRDSGKLQQENAHPVNDLSYDLSNRLKQDLDRISGKILESRPAVVIFGNVTSENWNQHITIPLYVKAPKVSVKTDNASLQTMLSNQTITGTGQAGDTVTIKDGSQTWTGQVQSDGSDDTGPFSIQTKGLKMYETVTITETNGTGDKSVSDPVEVTFVPTNSLNITKQPKYVVMDPNGQSPTFVDENGNTPEISGTWFNTMKVLDTCELVRVKGTAEDKAIWYGDYTNGIFYGGAGKVNTFTNQSMVPAFTNTAQRGNIVKVLPTNKELVAYMGQKNMGYTGYQWTYGKQAIPFYIKAPKVSVKTDNASLQTMLSNQTITGTGQAGDTVTIKDGSQTWTGQVQSDGSFSIQTKGLKVNDKVTITEVNGTGDKSVSDPLEITMPLMNITQQPKYIVYDPQSKTFVNENGSANFSLSGTWSSSVQGKNVFNWQI